MLRQDLLLPEPKRFRWADATERRGLVIEIDPPRRLAFRWRELLASKAAGLAVAGTTVVEFTLEAEGRSTRVTVTESHGVLAPDPGLASARTA